MEITALRRVESGLGDELQALAEAKKKAEDGLEALQFLKEALYALGLGHGDRKDRTYDITPSRTWYLLNENGEQMWARELLDNPEASAAKLGERRIRPLSEARTQECPNKHPGQLLVEYYRSTFHSVANGHEYMCSRYIMCLECRGLFHLSDREAS